MKHFLLIYDGGPDYAATRAPHRPAHLTHAQAAVAAGVLKLAGALVEPLDKSVFIFEAPDRGVVEAFAAQDPYVLAGIIKSVEIREWTTVVGPWALNPV